MTYIPTFYAVDLGLGLGLVGGIFVFGRILDVITDPLIGYLSDRSQSRWGPRRPWMILSAPFFCMAAWFLCVPPQNPNVIYLIFASGAYFLFYTALDVPYSAVGLEISPHVHERSVLASSKAIFQIAGAITAATLPLFFLSQTDLSLQVTAAILCGLSGVSLILFLKFVPLTRSETAVNRPSFFTSVKTAWSHRIYRHMILAFFIIQIANALLAALTVLFVTNVLDMAELTGLFLGVLLLSSALCLPFWILISKRRSKKFAWICSILLAILVLSLAPFLAQGGFLAVIVFSILIGSSFGCDAIMPTSMLADIVHKDEIDGNGRPAALYLAMKNALSKLTFIAPMGLAFPLLERAGLVSGAENSASAIAVLLFFYAALPILLRLLALGIVWKLPKTESFFA